MKQSTGTFVISLDFELYWGMVDVLPLADHKETLLRTREVIPQLLGLFDAYQIHTTWATVGFLFAKDRDEMKQSMPRRLPTYVQPGISTYPYMGSVGTDEDEDQFHYGASLIDLIASHDYQEIGTHTFSHYYCLEEGQNVETFEADLQAAADIGQRRGYPMRSIVFPRNQFDEAYVAASHRNGIVAYRGNESSWLYRAATVEKKQAALRRAGRLADAYVNLSSHNCYSLDALSGAGQPLNVPSSRMLRTYSPALRFLEPLRLHRILSGLTHAAKHGLLYHLWWHPQDFGEHSEENLAFLTKILDHYAKLNSAGQMRSLNMGEVADAIGARSGQKSGQRNGQSYEH